MPWEPPLVGCFKLNIDATVNIQHGIVVNTQHGIVGYASVAWNHEGLVMVTAVDVGVYSNYVDAMAEVLYFGLLLSRKIGLSLLIIELDSLWVIQFVLEKVLVFSYYNLLLICNILIYQSMFKVFNFLYILHAIFMFMPVKG